MARVYKKIKTNSKGQKITRWIIEYKDINGQRKRPGKNTKAEAERFLAYVLSNINKGLNSEQDRAIIFDKASEEYIKFDVELYCKPSTIDTYKRYLRVHLMPYFRGMKLVDISAQKVQEFIKHQLENTKLSNNSINKNVVLLGAILQKQVDDGVLFSNSVYKVKKLPVEKKEKRALTEKELTKLLSTCKKYKPEFYPLLLTASTTGMRRGEVLALKWTNINWESKEISVEKSIYKGQLVEPKTKTSKRKIKVDSALLAVLREWKLKSRSNDNDFVFSNNAGGSIDPRNLIRRSFEPIIKRAGIGKLTFHDLRHTFASIQIAKHSRPNFVQKQLGHSSIKVTMDIYSHLLPDACDEDVKAFDFLFDDKNTVA